MWQAGKDVLAGRSPYVRADPARLLADGNAFIPPPLLALLSVPLSILPFPLALLILDLVCGAACLGALAVVGIRDWRVMALVGCSFPFVASLVLGQPDGLFALVAALAWRYRDRRRGAVATGLLIALKLLAWPLLVWLLVTRARRAGIAALSAVVFLGGSWAAIGFRGLRQYPRLLAVDAHVFDAKSSSTVAAIMRLGAGEGLAQALALVFAATVALVVLRASRNSDLGWFTAAVLFGLLTSPILWANYLVVLFVPLAIARPRADWAWMLALAFWWSPSENPRYVGQVLLVLLVAGSLGAACRQDTVRTIRLLRRKSPSFEAEALAVRT